MSLKITQVDAFTDLPFHGNPAAVCVLPQAREARWMQRIAAEMNLSETAFLVRQEGGFGLRWFTPSVEVDLCGHATLASAHVLWEEGRLAPTEPARFFTRSGLLTARLAEGRIWLNFPAIPEEPATAPEGLEEALGVAAKYVGLNRFDYLVETDSEATVASLRPNMALLARLGGRGVIVTSRSASSDRDFVSRFFAPAAGIDEDPVTGSAHCCLGPFWAARLGKTELTGYQLSARGGEVLVRCLDDRVELGGRAVTVLRATLAAAAETA